MYKYQSLHISVNRGFINIVPNEARNNTQSVEIIVPCNDQDTIRKIKQKIFNMYFNDRVIIHPDIYNHTHIVQTMSTSIQTCDKLTLQEYFNQAHSFPLLELDRYLELRVSNDTSRFYWMRIDNMIFMFHSDTYFWECKRFINETLTYNNNVIDPNRKLGDLFYNVYNTLMDIK